MRPKLVLVLGTLALAPALCAQTLGESTTISATVTLEHPDPSCTFSAPEAITLAATIPCPTCGNEFSNTGSSSFSFSGMHATSWAVTITPPTTARNGSHSIPLDVRARSGNSPTSGTARGVTYPFSASWEYSVEAGPITSDTPPGTYTASITATGTCS